MNEPDENNSNESDLAFATLEKQKVRAFLRERFLRVVTGTIGKFRGCDVECSKVFVKSLKTPLRTILEAILRSSDIICFVDVDMDVDIDIIDQ